jgi:quercetin dioxygenase-like cupin family protein
MSRGTNETYTPGAKRAGAGEHVFSMAKVNTLQGGPDYSSAVGGVVEGDKIIVGLMRMAKGSHADPHHHPNEQWVYLIQGEIETTVDGKTMTAKAGDVVYFPANAVHSTRVTSSEDVVFFTCKDAIASLQGIKVK